MNQNLETNARRPARRTLSGAAAACVMAAVMVLGACEGDNLFSGDQGTVQQGPPIVTSITAPTSIEEGRVLDIRIRAVAPRGMDRVTVRYRRALNQENVFQFQGRTDTVTVDATITIPALAQDSILSIEVIATDVSGRVSEVFIRTVRIIDSSSPTVTATLTPTTASMGDTVRISISARDDFGLSAVGYAIIDAAGDTIQGPFLTPVTGTRRDTVFTVVLPDNLRPSTVRVVAMAVNNAQLRGVSSPLALNVVDRSAPGVSILRPVEGDSYPLSDSLLVRVHVADSGGISEVRIKGVAIRQDSLANTVVVSRYAERVIPFPQAPGAALPTDTVIQRFLLPTPITVSERVFIIATARDAAGNERADTVSITDGPRIEILNPAGGTAVGLGRSMLVHLRASDQLAGLDRVELSVAGVVQSTVTLTGLAPRTSLDTTLVINTGQVQGTITLTARVWNRSGVVGNSQPVTVTVQAGVVADNVPPLVGRQVTSASRVELSDSIEILVRATDGSGSGIARMGVVLTAVTDTLGAQHTFYRSTPIFSPPLSGTPERRFFVPLAEHFTETQLRFPRTFTVHIHAFAVDEDGNCGASVTVELASLPCDTTVVAGISYHTARGASPIPLQLAGTAGRSISIPGGGRIADVVVDGPRRRVYLSNIERNKIEIFDLAANTFFQTGSATGLGLVGAAPWGLFINNGGDSLFVANSGGTNISRVNINPADANYGREDVGGRILTPNTVLRDIQFSLVEGRIRYSETVHDFSDRPQFIAQHQNGTLVFSTLPTPASGAGTIRYVDSSLPRTDVRLLHNGYHRVAEKTIGIANVDSIRIVRATEIDDAVILFDRNPAGLMISAGPAPLEQAIEELRGQMSDIDVVPGAWDIPSISMQDTTFVAASGDRRTIAFGEGDRAPFGRIFLCCDVETTPRLILSLTSRPINVTDLVNNAAERVFGLGLSVDGTYGVARGGQATYFFTADNSITDPLRLQGEFRSGVAGGTGGAALHPNLSNVLEPNSNLRLAFIATGNRSIKIVDSVHYFERGEIPLRDNVVGPVRAILPTPAEVAQFGPADPNHLIMKLVAVTSGNNVVIINVRRKDVLQ